jgi:hypothetical protein
MNHLNQTSQGQTSLNGQARIIPQGLTARESDATACSRKTRSRRTRTEPFIHRSSSRLGSVCNGRGSFANDKASGQGGDQ